MFNRKYIIINKLEVIIPAMRYFAFCGNILYLPQLVRKGPNCLWLYNQSCIFFELLAKQKAANTKNILNGIPGVTTPIYAIANDNIPKVK